MDTHVILAQPRVPRLRADAGYVDRSDPRANGISMFFIVYSEMGAPLWRPLPLLRLQKTVFFSPYTTVGMDVRNVKQSSTGPPKRETVVNWTSET